MIAKRKYESKNSDIDDEYLESTSIDGDEGLHRATSGVFADEERLLKKDATSAARGANKSNYPNLLMYSRQQTQSGHKVPRALSFYSREHAGAKQASQAGNLKMLTCDQLSDLFRRLDRNGNGTLEKSEFMDIVKKLRLDVSEQFLLGVFHEVDSKTKTKGTLSLRDFIQCYQILYDETSNNAHSARRLRASRGGGASLDLVECLHAVRYGHDTVANRGVYEVYTGHSSGGSVVISEKKTFAEGSERGKGGGGGMGRYTVEEVDMDLRHLNLLMAQDSQHNSTTKSSLHWWLDVALEQVQASAVEKYIVNFGLPNDSRFRSRFSQFGDPLPLENNGNFHAGNGDTNLGSTSTLSLFTQAIWLSSVPVVYNTAPRSALSQKWAQYTDSAVQEWVQRYYDTRFAFMLAAFVSAPPCLRPQAYDSARSLARRFDEASDLDVEYRDEDDEEEEEERQRHRQGQPQGQGLGDNAASHRSVLGAGSSSWLGEAPSDDVFSEVPLWLPPGHRTDEPTWLQGTGALNKQTSRLVHETMGIHMIDMGSGPIATLTIRQLDDEGEGERRRQAAKRDAEGGFARGLRESAPGGGSGSTRVGPAGGGGGGEGEEGAEAKAGRRARLVTDSCRGVLGRLLVGVRRKLLENFYCKGVTAYAADLADGPFPLATHMVLLVNNFSMNTLGRLEGWKGRLEGEVNDLAVSKHIHHAHDLLETVDHIKKYVDHFHAKIEAFSVEAANEQATQCLVDELGGTGAAGGARTGTGTGGLGGEGSSGAHTHSDNMSYSPQQLTSEEASRRLTAAGAWGLLRLVRKVVDTSVRTHSVFPKGIEGTDLTYDMLKSFFGQDPLGDLNSLIYGNENLELAGLEYWQHRMSVLHATTCLIGQDIRESLDEKRNFYNYLLAVVTVFLGPMTILTGYWGMNFENMPELSVDLYPAFPGVKLLWAWGGLLYGLFFVLAIHYRIIYSAT